MNREDWAESSTFSLSTLTWQTCGSQSSSRRAAPVAAGGGSSNAIVAGGFHSAAHAAWSSTSAGAGVCGSSWIGQSTGTVRASSHRTSWGLTVTQQHLRRDQCAVDDQL